MPHCLTVPIFWCYLISHKLSWYEFYLFLESFPKCFRPRYLDKAIIRGRVVLFRKRRHLFVKTAHQGGFIELLWARSQLARRHVVLPPPRARISNRPVPISEESIGLSNSVVGRGEYFRAAGIGDTKCVRNIHFGFLLNQRKVVYLWGLAISFVDRIYQYIITYAAATVWSYPPSVFLWQKTNRIKVTGYYYCCSWYCTCPNVIFSLIFSCCQRLEAYKVGFHFSHLFSLDIIILNTTIPWCHSNKKSVCFSFCWYRGSKIKVTSIRCKVYEYNSYVFLFSWLCNVEVTMWRLSWKSFLEGVFCLKTITTSSKKEDHRLCEPIGIQYLYVPQILKKVKLIIA